MRVRGPRNAWLAVVYAATVLTIDTLATHGERFVIDWTIFFWRTPSGFDWFKFIAWFVVPFLVCIRRIDWRYFTFTRWRKVDAGLAVAALLAAGGAILAIRVFPSLSAAYPRMSGMPADAKWTYASWYAIWTLSWLIGWEFMHRYFLLRHVKQAWPTWGWVLIPLAETLYHLQKQAIEEALGMLAFSSFATLWTLRRRNLLLPFLGHVLIEAALLAYLLGLL